MNIASQITTTAILVQGPAMHADTTVFPMKAALLAIAMLIVGTNAHAANLVTNPDFSGGTFDAPGGFPGSSAPGWSGTGIVGIAEADLGGNWDNGYVPGGQGTSGFIGYMVGGDPGATLFTSVTGLTIGDQYELSFYANARAYDNGTTPAPAGDDATLVSASLGGTSVFTNQAVSNVEQQGVFDDPFQLFTATIIATGTTETLTFQNTGSNSNDTVEIADVSLSAIPEPATLGLLGSALFGLGMLRRRRAASSTPGYDADT